MRRIRRHVIWGWIIVCVIFVGKTWAVNQVEYQENEALHRFFQSKEHIFRHRWNEAREGFEAYLMDYPEGRLRDEGLYWLAYSLNMLSQDSKSEEHIISLKEIALDRLNELIEKHPKSLWRDDGLTLRVEIAGQLVLLGRESYKFHIDAAVQSQEKSEKEIKLYALNSLIKLDADYVLPIFKNLLESDPDPDIRKRCALLLGRYFSSESLELLKEIARSDRDKGVREEVAGVIERLNIRQIPVRLQYSVYGSRLLGDSQNRRFPEKKVSVVPLPLTDPEDEEGLLDAVRDVFNGKTSNPSRSAQGWMPYTLYYSLDSQTKVMNRAGDYLLWFPQEKIKVAADGIQGEVQFSHIETQEKLQWKFEVGADESRLAVLRSGDRLSLVILQFREIQLEPEKPQAVKTGSHDSEYNNKWTNLARHFGIEGKQVYHIEFSDLMGWEIHSSKDSWSVDDLTGKTDKYDFGQAEALSKEPAGWKLFGQLLLQKKERRFIARKAMLVDPDGKVFIGNEISVPVDSPSGFEVKGRRTEEKGPDLPDYGELEASGSFMLIPGVKVSTARESFKMEEFEKPLINFEQSKVVIAEKGSPARRSSALIISGLGSKTWTLLGDIFYLKKQERLVGFGAILVDPNREIKARGLISVPIDNPADFRILRGKAWKEKQLLLPEQERQTRYYYPCLNTGIQGWEVLTTLHSSDYGDETKRDFSLAQATRSHEGRDWILIGQILLLPKERCFIARDAALINSDGEVVFGAELRVSTDDPSQHKVIKK